MSGVAETVGDAKQVNYLNLKMNSEATTATPLAQQGVPTAGQGVKVAYIGGYGRSGSTLLVRLLGQIPGFFAVGEMWNIWQKSFIENELCGCGKPFHECDFWQAVVQQAFGGFDQVDLERIQQLRCKLQGQGYLPRLLYPRLRSVAQQAEIDEYCNILGKFYGAIQDVSGCKVIVDSSKGPRYAMLLRETAAIDLRLIHLTRDSRAVVYSWQKIMVKPEVIGKTEYMDRPNPVNAAMNWNITNLLTQQFQDSRAGYHFLRYEDLIEAPRARLADLVNFAGERVEEAALFNQEGAVEFAADHTAVGNPNRFKQGKIELRRDDEWHRKMNTGQRRLVTTLTLPLLRHYGYLRQPPNVTTPELQEQQ